MPFTLYSLFQVQYKAPLRRAVGYEAYGDHSALWPPRTRVGNPPLFLVSIGPTLAAIVNSAIMLTFTATSCQMPG